jgi:hypothetical protein
LDVLSRPVSIVFITVFKTIKVFLIHDVYDMAPLDYYYYHSAQIVAYIFSANYFTILPPLITK